MGRHAKALSIAKIVGVWLVTILLVLVFARAGFAKFSSTSGWARIFALWGYPVWFRVAVGVAEVGATALLLIPSVAAYGAITIILIMIGGMATHVVQGDPRHVTSELIPMLFALVVFLARRAPLIRLLRRRAPPAFQAPDATSSAR